MTESLRAQNADFRRFSPLLLEVPAFPQGPFNTKNTTERPSRLNLLQILFLLLTPFLLRFLFWVCHFGSQITTVFGGPPPFFTTGPLFYYYGFCWESLRNLGVATPTLKSKTVPPLHGVLSFFLGEFQWCMCVLCVCVCTCIYATCASFRSMVQACRMQSAVFAVNVCVGVSEFCMNFCVATLSCQTKTHKCHSHDSQSSCCRSCQLNTLLQSVFDVKLSTLPNSKLIPTLFFHLHASCPLSQTPS